MVLFLILVGLYYVDGSLTISSPVGTGGAGLQAWCHINLNGNHTSSKRIGELIEGFGIPMTCNDVLFCQKGDLIDLSLSLVYSFSAVDTGEGPAQLESPLENQLRIFQISNMVPKTLN
jgi:hypothetical protein